MKLRDIPTLYRAAWGVYEALRKLGFADEQIEHVAAPVAMADRSVSATPWLNVKLTASGQEFVIVIGELDRPFEEARTMLETVRCAIGSGEVSGADLERMWRESKMADIECFRQLAEAIFTRGIEIPAMKKFQN